MPQPIKLTLIVILLLIPLQILASDFVVIVQKDHVVDKLSVKQLRQIYLGKIRGFPDTDIRVIPLDKSKHSEHYKLYYKKVARKTVNQLDVYWAKYMFNGKKRPNREFDSDAEIIEQVRQSKNYIGYIEKQSLDDSVKVIYSCCGD